MQKVDESTSYECDRRRWEQQTRLKKALRHINECKSNSCEVCAKLRVIRMMNCASATSANEKAALKALLMFFYQTNKLTEVHIKAPEVHIKVPEVHIKVPEVANKLLEKKSGRTEEVMAKPFPSYISAKPLAKPLAKPSAKPFPSYSSGSYFTKKPKGKCSNCGQMFTIKKDGRIASHMCTWENR